MPHSLIPFIGQAAVITAFIVAALFVRGRSERLVRAYFAREGTVLSVRRMEAFSAFSDSRRTQEFRIRLRLPDGVEVTHAAELEPWGPVRRLW